MNLKGDCAFLRCVKSGGGLLELLVNHRVFQTNNLDSGRDFASGVWQKNDAQLRSNRYALTWNEVRLQRSSLSYVDHPCAVTARCERPLRRTVGCLPWRSSRDNPPQQLLLHPAKGTTVF